MKMNRFFWGWHGDKPTADPHMTRDLAARLIRRWRSDPQFTLTAHRDSASRTYRVRFIAVEATMEIRA